MATAWSFDMDAAPQDRRIMVWLPAQGGDRGRADFARWNADRYVQKPRPFWEIDGCMRVSESRTRQPIAWREEPEGPAASAQQEPSSSAGLIFPRELTPEILEVLGKPNFETVPIARAFREAGRADIAPRFENEQAFVLHWLVSLVLEHGSDWRKHMSQVLNEVISEVKAARAAKDAALARRDGGARG